MSHVQAKQEDNAPLIVDRLALRYIEGNLTFTSNEAWAWFVLPTQPWAFRSDSQREQSLLGFGDALTWLEGHRLHLRVTSRPYPTAEWASGLHRRTPNPLHTPGVPSWGDHLVDAQRHLRTSTMAEKEVYLGVRVSSRAAEPPSRLEKLAAPGQRRTARLLSQVERIRKRRPGQDSRAAGHVAELEWLMRRSVGPGLPAPGALSPVDTTAVGDRGPPRVHRQRRVRRCSARVHGEGQPPQAEVGVQPARHRAHRRPRRRDRGAGPGARAVALPRRPAAVPGRVVDPPRRARRRAGAATPSSASCSSSATCSATTTSTTSTSRSRWSARPARRARSRTR